MSWLDIVAHLSGGILYTLEVTLACAAAAFAIGLLAACLRHLAPAPIAGLVAAYTYVFRGVPVLVLLFIVFFALPPLGATVPPLLAMVLSLGLVGSAYLAEVFRGALKSVDANEVMAAEAAGLTRREALLSIELPQMLRFAVPGMVNEFTTILKYSPFAYMVGIPEITKQAMSLASTTLRGLEIYLAVGVLYFAIYRVLLAAIHWVEARYRVPGLAP